MNSPLRQTPPTALRHCHACGCLTVLFGVTNHLLAPASPPCRRQQFYHARDVAARLQHQEELRHRSGPEAPGHAHAPRAAAGEAARLRGMGEVGRMEGEAGGQVRLMLMVGCSVGRRAGVRGQGRWRRRSLQHTKAPRHAAILPFCVPSFAARPRAADWWVDQQGDSRRAAA